MNQWYQCNLKKIDSTYPNVIRGHSQFVVHLGVVGHGVLEDSILVDYSDQKIKSSKDTDHMSTEISRVDIAAVDTLKSGLLLWVVFEEAESKCVLQLKFDFQALLKKRPKNEKN